MNSAESSAQFHRLHQSGLLILANAWDAGSARLIENLGAPAIATSSAALAWTHGYADGDALPVPILAATVAEITRVIRVPLSVDMEGGYSTDPVKVGENVAAILNAGGVGINLEDGTSDPALLCAKIQQIKRVAARVGVNVFVNARTDAYLRDPTPDDAKLADVLARAESYRAAGADGIFVPGVVDAPSIRKIAATVKLPLNVLYRANLPGLAELKALGVRRLSAGSSLSQHVHARASHLAREFFHTGQLPPPDQAMQYRDLNALMA